VGVEFGASAMHPRSDSDAIRSALTADLADVVITTSTDWADWHLALQLAGNRATIACLGFPGRSEPPGEFNPLDSRYFYAKQLRLEAVGMSPERPEPRGFLRFNERDNLDYVTALILGRRLKPASLVSGTYAGNDLALAYEALLARERPAVTYLLRWAQG
jgi:threonine dehydrogenase-like Zn-dependent dehydrogenase